MQLIDTHAHIYLPEFSADLEQIINKAQLSGVSTIIMPAIDATTHTSMLQAEQNYSQCVAMMGLHPCSVKDTYREELTIVKNWLQQRKFAAIGEIGLDFYWDTTFSTWQLDAFHQQIKWALDYNLPIVIHSRNAVDECIEVIKQYPAATGIFHCFSGNLEQAQQITDAGFLLGIGGVVTFKNAGLDTVIQQLGLNHVVLETDAPYLAPVPYRGKRNESGYLPFVVQKLADVLKMDREEVAKITTANAQKIFSLY